MKKSRKCSLCNCKGCGKAATVEFKVHTEADPMFFSFCHGHMNTAVEVVQRIAKMKPV